MKLTHAWKIGICLLALYALLAALDHRGVSALRLNTTPTTYLYLPYLVKHTTPTPTSTPTATVTSTATPTPTASSTATVSSTATITPTPTASSTATPTPTSTPTQPGTLIPPDDLTNENAIADLINQQRIGNGLSMLAQALELTQAARRHSRDMADHNLTDHTGSDGSSGEDRIEEAGYDWLVWGEIIGWGFGGGASGIVNWWMNSPIHREIILTGSFDDLGVGYARSAESEWEHYWTVNFGTRSSGRTSAPQPRYRCTYTAQGDMGGSSLIVYSPHPCADERR